MGSHLRVLVTGAAGFIGSHTVDALVERGHQVTAVDSLDPQVHGPDARDPKNLARHVANSRIEFVRGDVRDRGLMERLLGDADAVLHLAAAVGVGQSMYTPHHYMDVNAGGTAMIADVLANRTHHVKKLVVASSMSIYGEGAYQCPSCGKVEAGMREPSALAKHDWEQHCPRCSRALEPLPTPESKKLDCTSIYAISKRVQEEVALVFGRAYGVSAIALRYFNVYGPRQSLNNPYTGAGAIFLSRLANGNAPLLFEDGLQTRDFIHVRDIARANVIALESDSQVSGAFNVGTGRAASIRALAESLARGLSLSIAPEVSSKYRAGDIRHCSADASRIRESLGFRAEISLDDGLRELIEWGRTERPTDSFSGSLAELEARKLVQ